MLYGLLNLSVTGYVIATLVLTQISIAAITIYLHRCQSHRALSLHPLVSHFFRFWLWMTTGIVTKQWVAIHRKHHANTEEPGDPHSPKIYGLKKVLLEGSELYRQAAKNKEIIDNYSHGTPNDWIERRVYSRMSGLGITLMFFIDIMLFGVPGITVWAVQMMWSPIFAAGIINGLGHHFGYRNFECPDAATNIVPWGIFIGGEELHNNHHTFASSAKLSARWFEFDLGWFYIRVLAFLGLAKIKKVPPQLAVDKNKYLIDRETVKAVIANRFRVLTHYHKQVILPVLKEEKRTLHEHEKSLFKRAKRLLRRDSNLLTYSAKRRLSELLAKKQNLQTVYQYRLRLQTVWQKTASSQKELIESLQSWCYQAENSGIDVLRQFAEQMKNYVPRYAYAT